MLDLRHSGFGSYALLKISIYESLSERELKPNTSYTNLVDAKTCPEDSPQEADRHDDLDV